METMPNTPKPTPAKKAEAPKAEAPKAPKAAEKSLATEAPKAEAPKAAEKKAAPAKAAAKKAASPKVGENKELEGYSSGMGIVADTRTGAQLAEAEARNAGVSGQAVMRSAPGGYANGAGQEIALATDESDTYVVTGGNVDEPALAQVPGEDHPTSV